MIKLFLSGALLLGALSQPSFAQTFDARLDSKSGPDCRLTLNGPDLDICGTKVSNDVPGLRVAFYNNSGEGNCNAIGTWCLWDLHHTILWQQNGKQTGRTVVFVNKNASDRLAAALQLWAQQ